MAVAPLASSTAQLSQCIGIQPLFCQGPLVLAYLLPLRWNSCL